MSEYLHEEVTLKPVAAQCTIGCGIDDDGVLSEPILGFMDSQGHEIYFTVPLPMMLGLMQQMLAVVEELAPTTDRPISQACQQGNHPDCDGRNYGGADCTCPHHVR